MTKSYSRRYGGLMLLDTVRGGVGRLLQRPGSGDATRYRAVVDKATALEDDYRSLSDTELADVDANDHVKFCAAAREAARRALELRVFDEQLMGMLALLHGRVMQMATGEGKTLAGALAAAGIARTGRGVHVLTVNDYLARRDAEWMAPVFELLGVSVDWVHPSHDADRRRRAYQQQVTYGAVSEIGFDVLRDRLVVTAGDRVDPVLDFAIIDEIDSVLVDEARVPLVLAGAVPAEKLDPKVMEVARTLKRGVDFRVDSERRNVSLTQHGTTEVEKAFGGVDLYTEENAEILASMHVALHATALLRKDVDYLVRGDTVRLISNSRGRVEELQRWPDGIQAAVEAKEGITPSPTGEALDSMTIGNFARRYRNLAGMTGTAVAVAEELREFHELEVDVVPTHKSCIRENLPDHIFDEDSDRLVACVERIAEVHETGRPVLIGTQSVAHSEELATALEERGLEAILLNARNDADEAQIIARAGEIGRITVSTQMAGRGTDIRLAEGVAELGGLCVIGYGRYESSRLDDQLRGRGGRQGDPGTSEFFVSLTDDLLAKYSDEVPESSDPRAGAAVDHAQRVAQSDNLQVHRTTWNYHHLIDQQRNRVLAHRDDVLTGDFAARDLRERCPKRYDELTQSLGEDTVADAARAIRLHHLDKRWTDHLAFLNDLREGIHLRALAKGLAAETPLAEFHREAMEAIRSFTEDVDSDSVHTFETMELTGGALDLATVITRPTSTWTYLISDTSADTDISRAVDGMRKALRLPQGGGKVALVVIALLLVVAATVIVLLAL